MCSPVLALCAALTIGATALGQSASEDWSRFPSSKPPPQPPSESPSPPQPAPPAPATTAPPSAQSPIQKAGEAETPELPRRVAPRDETTTPPRDGGAPDLAQPFPSRTQPERGASEKAPARPPASPAKETADADASANEGVVTTRERVIPGSEPHSPS